MLVSLICAALIGCTAAPLTTPATPKVVVVPPKIVEVPKTVTTTRCEIIPLTRGEVAGSPTLADKVRRHNDDCQAAKAKKPRKSKKIKKAG